MVNFKSTYWHDPQGTRQINICLMTINNLDMKHGVEMMLLLQKFVDELGKTIVVVCMILILALVL